MSSTKRTWSCETPKFKKKKYDDNYDDDDEAARAAEAVAQTEILRIMTNDHRELILNSFGDVLGRRAKKRANLYTSLRNIGVSDATISAVLDTREKTKPIASDSQAIPIQIQDETSSSSSYSSLWMSRESRESISNNNSRESNWFVTYAYCQAFGLAILFLVIAVVYGFSISLYGSLLGNCES